MSRGYDPDEITYNPPGTWDNVPLDYRWDGNVANPNRIVVGDVTPAMQTLTWPSLPGTVFGMARTDCVEFTHHCARDSSSIAEIWWNANTKRLTVRFHNGGVYSYDEVDRALYNDFCKAESMGLFFREHFRVGEWPGAKHNEQLVRFVAVPTEGPEEWADFDALKTTRLTSSADGGNKQFTVHYEFSGKGDVDVRARDLDEAVALVQDYFEDKGIPAAVTGVFVAVK